MVSKLVRSGFCCSPEWENEEVEEDDFVAKVDLDTIRVYLAGADKGKDGLTIPATRAGCIMPPKGCVCNVMCKQRVHEELC